MKKDLCFYIEGQTGIIDTVTNKLCRGHFSAETVEEIQARYLGAEVVPFDYALERINEALKEKYPMLKPREITEEEWFDALECLPPMHYRTTPEGLTFKCSEMMFNDITSGYVKKNGKFYSMWCRTKTTAEEMVAVC